MIGQLRGLILEKQPPQLLLNVNGVGYEISASMSTFYQLPQVGEEVILFTHLVVREDAHNLYGFYAKDERLLFRTLLKVNGIGPRLGLTILSSMDPNEFVTCILNNDAESLLRLPGVGKKMADRLIIEMRDRLSDWQPTLSSLNNKTMLDDATPIRHQSIQDAVSALIALGYKSQEATRIISSVDDGNLNSEEMIRQALKKMVK